MSAFQIDNRQPPMAQPNAGRAIEAVIVRSAMADRIGHGFYACDFDGGVPPRFKNTANSTHILCFRYGTYSSRAHRSEMLIDLFVFPYHRIH